MNLGKLWHSGQGRFSTWSAALFRDLVIGSARGFGDSIACKCCSGLELLLGTLVHYLLRKVFPIIYSERSSKKVSV